MKWRHPYLSWNEDTHTYFELYPLDHTQLKRWITGSSHWTRATSFVFVVISMAIGWKEREMEGSEYSPPAMLMWENIPHWLYIYQTRTLITSKTSFIIPHFEIEECVETIRQRLRAVYPFTGRNHNEMSLKMGDVVSFRRHIDENWTEVTMIFHIIAIYHILFHSKLSKIVLEYVVDYQYFAGCESHWWDRNLPLVLRSTDRGHSPRDAQYRPRSTENSQIARCHFR